MVFLDDGLEVGDVLAEELHFELELFEHSLELSC